LPLFLILCDALDFFVCFRHRSRGHPEKYYFPLKKVRERITSPKTIEETSGPGFKKTTTE